MNVEFTDGAVTWHVYVDEAGELHDEPVEPAPADQAPEPAEDQH